jgi:Ca2+/Na+ antiporter
VTHFQHFSLYVISAIILFSGLGSLDEAQETLSIGVGALAGSTIMLLTVPWGLSVFAGRADLVNGKPSYTKKPKLTAKESIKEELNETGVAISDEVKQAGIVMACTTLPYFLIQIPALFLHGPTEEIAEGEHWWSLAAFICCLAGLVYYMRLQLHFSAQGQDKDKRIAITKKILMEGKLSLAGALQGTFESAGIQFTGNSEGEYQSMMESDDSLPVPPPEVASYLKEILWDAFKAYDKDQSGRLEKGELRLFFKDFHENIGEQDIDSLLKKADKDCDGTISFDEFIGLAYNLISCHGELQSKESQRVSEARIELVEGIWNDDDEEAEEIPEDFTDLSPAEQQTAIKWRAFRMLAWGTVVVVYFSDPMVDVMQEIAVRSNLSPFYVSFVLAPLASNASEVIASMYYASKKTRKTMSVSLSALEGAASMNNTFW